MCVGLLPALLGRVGLLVVTFALTCVGRGGLASSPLASSPLEGATLRHGKVALLLVVALLLAVGLLLAVALLKLLLWWEDPELAGRVRECSHKALTVQSTLTCPLPLSYPPPSPTCP